MKNNSNVQPQIQDLTRLSLINNLKKKIESLKQEVSQQRKIIETYKRSTKITLLNEQQIQIQKLNDENKRLLLIIQDMKVQNMTLYNGNNAKTGMLSMNSVLGSKYFSKSKYGSLGRSSAINNSNNSNANSGLYTSSSGTKKKQKQNYQEQNINSNYQSNFLEQHQTTKKIQKKQKNLNYEQKYFQIVLQNQKIRKQLIILKANEKNILNLQKNKKAFNERSSILLENNINQFDKIRQKNYQLEAELANCQDKNTQLKRRVHQLEELLERALQINKSLRTI